MIWNDIYKYFIMNVVCIKKIGDIWDIKYNKYGVN